MAKVQYTKNLFNYENLTSFDETSFKLASVKTKEIVFTDGDGARMVLHGTGISREKGKITTGEITSAEFFDADGKKIYTFTDVSAQAADIYTTYTYGHRPNRVMHGLMQGDDTVTGSKFNDSLWGFGGNDTMDGKAGNDYLYGHAGDDTLTGGKGADHFAFLSGGGHDTVTDFALGKGHDFIYMDYYLYDEIIYTQDGDNLVLSLQTGEQLTLKNVLQAQISENFFEFF